MEKAERNTERGNAVREGERELTAKEIADTVFWSFYYSQGSGDMQEDILEYAVAKHPEWNFNDETTRTEAIKILEPRMQKFLASDLHKGVGSNVEGEAMAYVGKLAAKAMRRDKEIKPLCQKILGKMIGRDNNFRLNRPRRKAQEKGPFAAAMSHFTEYVIGKQAPPGPHIYQELMVDLRAILEDPSARNAFNIDTVRDLINTHNNRYPERPVALPID